MPKGALWIATVWALSGPAFCRARESDRATMPPDAPAPDPRPKPTAPPETAAPRVPRASCRALAVRGDVRIERGRAPVRAQATMDPDDWLSLGVAARLVVKDPLTGRETTLHGPGRARACVDSLEESWVAGGTFESSAGSGESPGAEEWVVTPLGVVRFGAARLEVDVRPEQVRVTVGQGVAFLRLASDASGRDADGGQTAAVSDDGWRRVAEGAATLAPTAAQGAGPPLTAARTAVDACAALGSSARALAAALLRPALDASRDAAYVSRQVATRRLARAACAIAGLRVGMLSSASDAERGLASSLRQAARQWQELPVSE